MGVAVKLFAVALSLGTSSIAQFEWQKNYNLYWGSGNDISITKMFVMPSRNESVVDDKTGNTEYYDHLEELYFDHVETNQSIFDDSLQPSKLGGYDSSDFSDIKDSLENISDHISHFTRRGMARYCTFCYLGDVDPYEYWFNPERNVMKDKQRIYMVRDLILMWLLHGRRKMKEAIAVRNVARDDKRYMIGYLFHRQRILLREVRDIYRAMAHSESTAGREFRKLVYSYKQIVRLDVDIKDNMETIQHVITYVPDPPEEAGY